MEELLRGLLFSIGYIFMFIGGTVDGQDGSSSHSSLSHNRAYFNSSTGSSATLSNVLSMRNHISLSFRTCSYGRLIYQRGASGDYLNVTLTPNGSLEMSWFKSDLNVTNFVSIGDNSLRNNQWYTLDSKFINGEINLTVESGQRALHQMLISNSTYQRELWDLDLSGDTKIQVGNGFTGCIQEGPSIQLSADDVVADGLSWGECPLESRPTEGCDAPVDNPCWRYPCQNGGTCSHTGGDYQCSCPVPYRGRNCEEDLGDLACDLSPCQNGGTCRSVSDLTRKYECNCVLGFTGVNCEINIDECAPEPCRNGGSCQDLVNGYKCNCSDTGYKGDHCSDNINECGEFSPCQNGARCMDTPGNYKCECLPGFAGHDCADGLNECESEPCKNGGTCQDNLGYYSCSCLEGFTGVNCEVNIDDCMDVTCTVPFTQCLDGINSYTCLCLPGYTDPSGVGGNATECTEIDECLSNPCQNGATCRNWVDFFTCDCVTGYTGSKCEVQVDECASQPCLNGAECKDEVASYSCTCLSGFTDPQCGTNIDECMSTPCQNGATCNDLVSGYNCSCSGGWSGRHCEVPINECLSDPCKNGGICFDEANAFRCDCLDGFTGTICETNIDDCAGNPCENGGTCHDKISKFECECPKEWMGETCTQQYNACSLGPCQNNGTCSSVPPNHDYTCSCLNGFEGDNCEFNIDDCVGHSCANYQVCVDGINDHSCECPNGYTGSECAEEINECASNPCQNGGTCTDGVGNYTCTCVGEVVNLTQYSRDPRSVFRVGYEGPNCEIEIEECAYIPPICLNNGICGPDSKGYGFQCYCPNGGDYYAGRFCHIKQGYCNIVQVPDEPVCHNGGTCNEVEGKEDYYCSCAPGFTGDRCKTNIDECESNPCLHNGTCEDGVDGYTCRCAPGLTGVHCETNIDECKSYPCQNGGICDDIINGYHCNCSGTGFEGTHCQLDIDDCESNPCQNFGTCDDKVKGFTCKCYTGYEGDQCEIDIDECLSNPCQNGATCTQRSDTSRPDFNIQQAFGYECLCVPGYTGVECRININECESNPCMNGNCKDLVDGYKCECDPGWTGGNCELEIDECKVYSPCVNGATCHDKLADYSCECPPEQDGVLYGGKNCSTKLTGCHRNGCQNGATCVPALVNEEAGTHDYTCTCPPGFVGKLCEAGTTGSFYGDTWIKYQETDGKPSADISLRFRTTLSEGILLINYGNAEGDYILVKLTNGTHIEMFFINAFSQTIESVSTPGNVKLNDSNWVSVALSVTQNWLTLTLKHPTCPDAGCSVYIPLSDSGDEGTSRHHTLGVTYFGMFGGGRSETLPPLPAFIGCLQDMALDSTTIVPQDYVGNAERSNNLVDGCPRTEQCNPDPCNGNGDCTDLWHQFKCDCRRPYIGDACDDSYMPATFGYEDKASYANFDIPIADLETLKSLNDITLFFRTRKESGLLFYLGGDERGPAQNQTFISSDLMGSSIRTRVKLSNSIETFMFDGQFADGEQHFLNVKRENERLRVMVNEAMKDFTLQLSYNLYPQHLFIGGIAEKARRRRRQADDDGVTLPVDADPYKGTIQDARQNGKLMPFFAQNMTDQPPSYDLPVMENVMAGEVSEDVCNRTTPCVNNGTCSNVFFNDFSCECPDGYRGKNCSELDFCMYVTCPQGSSCNNLEDGFECVAPVTFNGADTAFTYTHTADLNKGITSVSAKIRSRQDSGSILRIQSTTNDNYLSLEFIGGGRLSCSYNLGVESQVTSDTSVDLLDGEWHDVSVHVESDKVRMMVNQVESSTNSPQTSTLSNLLAASTVTVGKSTADSFKGCLNEVRVGGVLLPFFSKSEIVNNTAAEQFYVETVDGAQVGCVGDPVCDTHQCQNGATCVDVWNKHECDCSIGFNGTLCQNNIDDCVGHDCQNGATCVDGIANFTCDCVPGYTGEKCQTDIYECASNPCLNNGTCIDEVNGYSCNCTENFVGDYCEFDLRETCDNDPCQNNATCIEVDTKYPGVVTFNCSCVPGFTGTKCETEIDYCEGDPCQNNATCISDRSILSYTCSCVEGYTGYDCETEIDECASDPCQNGATCIDKVGEYECQCLDGFEGVNCENDIDECNMTINGSLPCENNGICINLPGSYKCNCTGTGYEGDRCEIEIDECENDPCKNGGTCINYPGDYGCNCTIGYTGKNCEIVDCNQGQCLNGATCTDDGQVWSCTCVDFYEGDMCQIRGACVGAPCQNGANCTQSGPEFQDYTCHCVTGWRGQNCSEDIDECTETPDICNDGNCTNTDGGYFCTCNEGFTGSNCDTEIDYCQPNPCINSGICSNIEGGPGFTCDCTGTGFRGETCEEEINECLEEEPCKNGGTCTNLTPGYECTCTDEYLGDNCTVWNPCNGSYCLNGADCTPLLSDDGLNATASCNCTVEWEGPRCETATSPIKAKPQDLIPLVVGVIVAGFIVIIIIVVIVLIITARNKRATRGTYSPSRQEMSGSRVEMGNVLKPPPEERLI